MSIPPHTEMSPAPSRFGRSPTYVVAGGHQVTVLVDRAQSEDRFDVIDVVSEPGAGSPVHRHPFAAWFRVTEGVLTLWQEHGGRIGPAETLAAGQSVLVAPSTYHRVRNLSPRPCTFQVVGQPAMLSSFIAEAGVRVFCADDALAPPTVGCHALRDVARRWGIEVPHDATPHG